MNSPPLLKITAAITLFAVLISLVGCEPECPPLLLEIIDRTSWGAAEPDIAGSNEGYYDPIFNPGGWYVYPNPLDQQLNTLIIHHSATAPGDTPGNIQQVHMTAQGYADIAYQFLIDEGGLIYEGRSITVRGAHTGGHNTGTVGIVLIGNFESDNPTFEQLCSLKHLSTYLKNLYHITHLAGHHDFQPEITVCPGEHLAEELPGIAAELGLEFGTAGYIGTPIPQ